MARVAKRLTALAVLKMKEPGRYPDGDGLYLRVVSETSKSWFFRYVLKGKERWMGLGSVKNMALAEARDAKAVAGTSLTNAREAAAKARRIVHQDKRDPIEVRDAQRKAEQAKVAEEKARSMTFWACAAEFIEHARKHWTSERHAGQWTKTFEIVNKIIGDMAVRDIAKPDIVKVLKPIWQKTPATAMRIRGRIEAVLDYAHAGRVPRGREPGNVATQPRSAPCLQGAQEATAEASPCSPLCRSAGLPYPLARRQ